MTAVQVLLPEYSDVRIFYDDYNPDKSITRTLAMRFTNGGIFTGEVGNGRRILIEEVT